MAPILNIFQDKQKHKPNEEQVKKYEIEVHKMKTEIFNLKFCRFNKIVFLICNFLNLDPLMPNCNIQMKHCKLKYFKC